MTRQRLSFSLKRSQSLGNGETPIIEEALKTAIASRLPELSPTMAGNLQPDYLSPRLTAQPHLPRILVKYYDAPVLGGLVEPQLNLPVLSVSGDGTRSRTDGTIRGGKIFLGSTPCFL